ncbi:hypothetical protein Ccrd_026527 [Cynara cardunculus var. scolymus]|uniref:Uncharacterized protein n=1 Tax=Cynara cardunculus var. scolymus TaxID=59895 RepID=A0A103P002_CYNCS|nr:hypothetical protein Ccrd_026527 [Cynara cardunculus var. scolymus]
MYLRGCGRRRCDERLRREEGRVTMEEKRQSRKGRRVGSDEARSDERGEGGGRKRCKLNRKKGYTWKIEIKRQLQVKDHCHVRTTIVENERGWRRTAKMNRCQYQT